MDKHQASFIIAQNATGGSHFDDNSFAGKLHEEEMWDHALFSKLSEAISRFTANF